MKRINLASKNDKILKITNKKIYPILFILLSLFLLKSTVQEHATQKRFNYHSEIWADKGGYYVYLPAYFYYDFKANKFPDSIDNKTGNGFNLNKKNNKVKTKYTYGIALLESPFFLMAHSFSGFLNQKTNGFSLIYFRSIDLAAIFYSVIGLYFLFLFLSFYFQRYIAFLSVLICLLGTHLFYYTIVASGMSHVYSFALIAIFFYLIKKNNFLDNAKVYQIITAALLYALIILIRPTNIILASSIFIFDCQSIQQVKYRIKKMLTPKILLIFFVTLLLIFLPQFFYWKYLTGSFLIYPYQNEGFNFLNPEFIKFIFSTNSGLLTYTPLFLITIFTPLFIKKNRTENIFIFAIILLMCYVYSSWWIWSFGCSLGSRNFVEYATLLSFPLATILSTIIYNKKFLLRMTIGTLFILVILHNLSISNNYDVCYYGKNNWDWVEYKKYIMPQAKK